MTPELPATTGEVIRRAYAEDLGSEGDLTSIATIPEGHRSIATFVIRASGCVAGIPIVELCLAFIDPSIVTIPMAVDGEMVEEGRVVLTATGSTRSLLSAERVALNLLGHLSGVATATRTFVDAIDGTGAVITDTRKTTPMLRGLEKYAVATGGGENHRMGLYDAVIIKDNHLVASTSIADAVERARDCVGDDMVVEIEVDTLAQLEEAIETSADVVLLDNMTPEQLRQAVRMVGKRKRTEASGGVTVDTVRATAETGVDTISVGWLTHSSPALDVSMDLETV